MSTSAARVVTALRAPRESVPVVTQVRSTLLSTSLGVVRERGLWDRYREGLSRAEEESMVSLVPGSWVPVELALAHYDAMERLAFAPDEQLEIGKRVTFTIQRSVLGTLVRLAAGAGATPWDALSQFHRLWDRVFQGGDGAVYQLGLRSPSRFFGARRVSAGARRVSAGARRVSSEPVESFRGRGDESRRSCRRSSPGAPPRSAWRGPGL